MAKVLRVGDKEECGADKKYYDCSHSDFNYTGCCSHNPCIKPRGCRDDSVTSDLSSWPTSDMSDTETNSFEDIPTGNIISLPDAVISEVPETSSSRRKPSASLTMSDDEETSSPDRHTAPSTTKTDSGITHTVSNPNKVTITNRRTTFISQAPPTPTGFLTSVTSAGTDQFPFPTGSFDGTATSLPTETSTSGASPDDSNNTGSPSIGLVVGAAIGGIAFLALIIVAVVCIRRRKAKQTEFPNTPYYLEEKADKSLLSRMLSRKSTRRSEDPFAPFGGMLPDSSSDSSSDDHSLPKRILKLLCRPYRQSRQPPPAPRWHF